MPGHEIPIPPQAAALAKSPLASDGRRPSDASPDESRETNDRDEQRDSHHHGNGRHFPIGTCRSSHICRDWSDVAACATECFGKVTFGGRLSLQPLAVSRVGEEIYIEVRVRPAALADAAECGRVCFKAFAAIASRHGFAADFPSEQAAADLWTGLIAHPGFYCVVAEAAGKLVGCNGLDERAAIFSMGPVTVDPEAQDDGVGRALVTAILQRSAQQRPDGVRLLQAAYHNRSLSLYAKFGFDVREPFAAMQGNPLSLQLPGYRVRTAEGTDRAACNELCMQVHGHDRRGELADALSHGTARVVERRGRVTGYTTGIGYYGHSVAESTDDIVALAGAAEEFPGPGFLLPMRNTELLRWCLGHGLRIKYTMNLMTIGLYQEPRGAFLASVGY
jgi:predicted N-acetyltransferase YhbS